MKLEVYVDMCIKAYKKEKEINELEYELNKLEELSDLILPESLLDNNARIYNRKIKMLAELKKQLYEINMMLDSFVLAELNRA